MIYDYWKSHNLADEQLDDAYGDCGRGRDDAGSEVDLMLSNARLQPLVDVSELCASAQGSAMDANQKGLERTTKDDLVFPTDAAALLFAVLIFGLAIFKRNQGFLVDPDTYWHIAAGKWMLAERSFPWHDIFSHTAAGQPWVNMEWLAQIILASTYDWFGWRGLIVLGGLVVAVTFVLLYKLLARELRAAVALGAAAISFLFASFHFLARPHLLACPIIVVWTAHLARASAENRRPSLWLLPLMVLWANLHGGFTLGLLLTGGVGLEAIIASAAAERRRVATQWILFGIGSLLAACITPYGYECLLQTYHVFNLGEILHHVGEWRPMNPYEDFAQELVLLSLLALALISGVKIGIVRVLMIVGLLHMSLQHARGLAIFALVLPFLVAHPLRQQFTSLRPSVDPFPLFDRRGFRSLRTAIALLVALVASGMLATTYAILRPDDAPPGAITPAAAVDNAIGANITGPVFNHYNFGGYLIFRGIPTFIDGRALPFGKEFCREYIDADGGNKLDELVDKYGVTWTLLPPKSSAMLHFDQSPHWRRVYADDVAVVHVRR
jgi:hypothetical protein